MCRARLRVWYEYELEGFRATIEGVLEDSVDHLITGVGGFDNFDHILFTGGGARVYYDFMSKRMPKLRPVMRLDESHFRECARVSDRRRAPARGQHQQGVGR